MNMCTVCTYNADPENTLFLRPEISKTALLRRKTLENGGMIGKSAVGKAWSLRKPESVLSYSHFTGDASRIFRQFNCRPFQRQEQFVDI